VSKKITQQQLTGQLGINLIEKIVLDMGFVWRQTGMDAGIDGQIEIRNADTSALCGKLLHVQSKATAGHFRSEDDRSFVFRCRVADLEYWRGMNTPVLLILSRPETAEAYWICIQEYLSRGGTKTVRFNKVSDRFDVSAKLQLERLFETEAAKMITANSTSEVARSGANEDQPVLSIPYGRDIRLDPSSRRHHPQDGSDVGTTSTAILFLHSQTSIQQQYHATLQKTIQDSTGLSTVVDEVAPMHAGLSQKLLTSAQYQQDWDKLVICQLDEHCLPSFDEDPLLRRFASRSRLLEDFDVPSIRVGGPSNGWSYVAPYYINPSVLALRCDLVDAEAVTSWRSIISVCNAWQKVHPGAVAFDFASSYDEDFNCLFLEILVCVVERGGTLESVYANWITLPEAVEAALMLRELCRPAHLARAYEGTRIPSLMLAPEAIVWRHWYSTFAELALSLPWDQRETVVVAPLPGGINLAGEWYLAVPRRSAALDYAIEIVQELTKPAAELERLICGVGLPTRPSFYNVASPKVGDWRLAIGDLAINTPALRSLIGNAILRSSFRSYASISVSLARHLRRIVELPEEEWGVMQDRIRAILQNVG
jgi:hypothetical protein